ncbi:hypothetical protein [Streptomyces sp. NPDC052496]|uniref:hypothetical protein n=1 Tax=Streptomyces sp. NPDC052496 TaxID=3154951 RepID=UPI003434B7EE
MSSQPEEGADAMRRVLLFLLAALLAFPVGTEGAYGRDTEGAYGRTAGSPYGRTAEGRSGASAAEVAAPYEDGGPADSAAGHCPTGRAARSATGIPAFHPGDQVRSASDPTVPPAAGPAPAAPVTGRRAVPLKSSGQLPISHRVFRC